MKSCASALQVVKQRLSSNWNTPKSVDVLKKIIATLCKEHDSPYGLAVNTCLKYNDYDALLKLTVNPLDYEYRTAVYAGDAQIEGLIKKYPYWTLSLDPKVEAMKTFIAAEIQCKNTNRLILSGSLNKDPFVASVLHEAQRIIAKILGDVPEMNDLQFKFGPGVNLSVKNNTTAYDKLNSSLEVSPICKQLADKFLATCPGIFKPYINEWPENRSSVKYYKFSMSDKLTFVDKNAKTLRPIGITGVLNSVIQRGYGICIRDKLKPLVDLRNTQEKHKELARHYSRTRKGCTIDLASASDTISCGIIRDLLPLPWYDALNACRVTHYEIDDIRYEYQKFSAMGNGYTFELETLLFYAISRAVCFVKKYNTDMISVYGDDIVAPNEAYPAITKVLEACGFSVNNSKSFHTGNFRESCGGDYMGGVDVRPFCLKDHITPRTLFLMHNFFVRRGLTYVYRNTFFLIRKLLGKPVCALFRGNYLDSDNYLLDYDCEYPPSYIVEEKIRKRKLPSFQSFDALKSFALYRQMYPEFLQNIEITWKMGQRRGMKNIHAALSGDQGKFYAGVSPILDLPAITKNPRFTVRSFAGQEHFFSTHACRGSADLLKLFNPLQVGQIMDSLY